MSPHYNKKGVDSCARRLSEDAERGAPSCLDSGRPSVGQSFRHIGFLRMFSVYKAARIDASEGERRKGVEYNTEPLNASVSRPRR